MNNQEIIKKIEDEFRKVQNNSNVKTRKEWTSAFLHELGKIGHELGYDILPNKYCEKKKPREPEWVFDLCWSIHSKEWTEKWEGLKLICECEWNMSREEIIVDFQKLAVAIADIKIMIVQHNKSLTFNTIKKWCEDSIKPGFLKSCGQYYLVSSGPDKLHFERLW
jgi:hypothetical protein